MILFGTDDIEIDDEPVPVASASSQPVKNHKKGESSIFLFLYFKKYYEVMNY